MLAYLIIGSERQRSPSAHLVRRRGGTPCWNFLFGCSCPGPVRNRGRVVDALSIDGSGGSVGRAVGHYSDSNVSVHPRRTLCAVGVERLVGIFILAVHALALSEIVAASSMLFARGWWRVHFTCGSPYILIPTSGFWLRRALAPIARNPLFDEFFLDVFTHKPDHGESIGNEHE